MSHVRINTDTLQTIFKNIQQYSINPRQTHIVAVTKKFSHMAAIEAIKNNIFCIGENQVQEFENKHQQLLTYNFEAHLIGHLQSNKINKAIKLFNVIETVDSFKLAVKLNKQLKKINQKQNIYIQINIGEDPNKHGFMLENIYKTIETISAHQQLRLVGLMTILPFYEDTKKTQPLFAHMKEIQNKTLKDISPVCKFLSMGMSRDYIYALKEGATHLRIGTKLYGQRA